MGRTRWTWTLVAIAVAALAAVTLWKRGERTSRQHNTETERTSSARASGSAAEIAVVSRPESPKADLATRNSLEPETRANVGASPTDCCSLAGTVIDVSGTSVRAFKVIARRKKSGDRDDAPRRFERDFEGTEGAFQIEKLPAGSYRLSVVAEGYMGGKLDELSLVEGERRANLVMHLERETIVRGKVVEVATGAPISDARIGIESLGSNGGVESVMFADPNGNSPRSGADGSFEILRVKPGTIRLEVSHSEYVEDTSATLQLNSESTLDAPTFALRRGGSIDGIALTHDEKPLAKCNIFATPVIKGDLAKGRPGNDRNATADDLGRFRLAGLSAGTWIVTSVPALADMSTDVVHARATTESRAHAIVEIIEGVVSLVEIRAPKPGCMVKGHLTRSGRPLPRWNVSIVRIGEMDANSLLNKTRSATTDDEGEFVFDSVKPGPSELQFEASSEMFDLGAGEKSFSVPVEVPDGPEHTIDVVVPEGWILQGRITHRSNGTPVAKVVVTANPIGFSQATFYARGVHCLSNPDGRFVLRGFKPGLYRVTIGLRSRRGDVPVFYNADVGMETRVVELTEGATTTADFVVDAGGTVAVDVLNASGAPIARAIVEIVHSTDIRDLELSNLWTQSATTDKQGRGRVQGVGAGRYVVVVRAPGMPFTYSDEIEVAAARELHTSIRIPEGVHVRVHAAGPDGSSPAAARALLRDERNRCVGGGETSSLKRQVGDVIEIAALPGKHQLVVEAIGFKPSSQDITVTDEQVQTIEVKLEKADGAK